MYTHRCLKNRKKTPLAEGVSFDQIVYRCDEMYTYSDAMYIDILHCPEEFNADISMTDIVHPMNCTHTPIKCTVILPHEFNTDIIHR